MFDYSIISISGVIMRNVLPNFLCRIFCSECNLAVDGSGGGEFSLACDLFLWTRSEFLLVRSFPQYEQ